jgi:hypothetical protein
VHTSPSDIGLLSDARHEEALEAHLRVSRTVRAFFDEHLRFAGSFIQYAKSHRTVEALDLNGILEAATRSADRTTSR